MDVINSTPYIDYGNNTVWVTSHNNGDAGSSANLPDVWKLNANTGAVLAAVNLGSNIDSSPSPLPNSSAIIVGTGTGALYAFDAVNTTAGPPTVPTQLATIAGVGDGAIKGFPVMATTTSPYTIIVSTTTKVTAYSFPSGGSSFTQLWSTSMGCNPSTALTVSGLLDASSNPVVYVGCSDGKLHELLLSTGVDETASARIVDTAAGVVVGDPTLDTTLNKVFVGASDGRVYAFSFPF
jgi:outer membrane protein assembly factor BamB